MNAIEPDAPGHRSLPFSIYWEVRTLLYLGVLFLSSGLGILVYRHMDTIGHQAVLLATALLAGASLGYCGWKGAAFTSGKPIQASPWLDYVLLLGVLLFGIFTGYLQFEYSVFGAHYGLAVGLPGLLYLFLAYRFDHRGVLQLAISGIAAAFGIIATPLSVFREGLFQRNLPVYAGLSVAAALAASALLSEKLDFKRHFAFGYLNFAVHLGMWAALAGMFTSDGPEEIALTLVLALSAAALWKYAQGRHSRYFLLCAMLYGYTGFTYAIRGLLASTGTLLLYFLLSCAGAIFFFLNLKTLQGGADAGIPEK